MDHAAPSFPVVGVGASAGGLEALQEFLGKVPVPCGLAFVVVPHLDASHHGPLVELLQRATRMPVAEITNGALVAPDHVYVIPPGKDLSIVDGVLHLLPKASTRSSLPIDFFFRSLAADRRGSAIGVILSGMGSDGTLGLRAIKEHAGAAFVQSIASAKFDGMPRSAIGDGLADVVAPAAELPARILAYCARSLPGAPESVAPASRPDAKDAALEELFALLRARSGNDFSRYERTGLLRRIERRIALRSIDGLPRYVAHLREDGRELDRLYKDLLVGVTSFFRDPATWDHLRTEVLPGFLASRASGGVLRAWVAGCSTGEEAYSLAMVFKEALEPREPVKKLALQIFATDVDEDAIETARRGRYPESIAADVSTARLRRFFVREDDGYRVARGLRDMVVFAQQNVISDPPFSKVDILSCRNLLVLLSTELRATLIQRFRYCLNPGGILLFGAADSLFVPVVIEAVDSKACIYRRRDDVAVPAPVDLPATVPSRAPDDVSARERAAADASPPPSLQALTDRLIVQRFAPVAVLCSEDGEVQYLSGRSGKYLEPAVGKATFDLFAMARPGLRHELSRAFAAALRADHPVTVPRVLVETDGGARAVDVTVQKLVEPRELAGRVIVVIADASPGDDASEPRVTLDPSDAPRVERLEQELRAARDELQTAREQMQAVQEELQSANEELRATNAELQSTNDSLTTSREELQAGNAELQSTNRDLATKVDLLSRSNDDMTNLMNGTQVATLFLDDDLRVRRFTTPTSKLLALRPQDTGRPITDIASDLDYAALADDAREVLRTLVSKETRVLARDGRTFVVRILPYRTLDNVIDGVVITFADASASRALEAALDEQTGQMRQIADALPSLVWTARPDGSCDYVSRRWAEYAGVPDAALLGYGWFELVHPDDRARARAAWRTCVESGGTFDVELRLRNAVGAYRWFHAGAFPLRAADGTVAKLYGTHVDVDDLKSAEAATLGGLDRLDVILHRAREALILLDAGSSIERVGAAAERLFSRAAKDLVHKPIFEALPELRGAPFEPTLKEALASGRPATCELRLGRGALAGAYDVRIVPHRLHAGVSIFVDRAGAPS